MTAWLDDFRAAANIWLQPVCALAVPDTSVGERGWWRTAQIFMSGTLHMLCSGGDS